MIARTTIGVRFQGPPRLFSVVRPHDHEHVSRPERHAAHRSRWRHGAVDGSGLDAKTLRSRAAACAKTALQAWDCARRVTGSPFRYGSIANAPSPRNYR